MMPPSRSVLASWILVATLAVSDLAAAFPINAPNTRTLFGELPPGCRGAPAPGA